MSKVIASFVKERRRKTGMTQAEFADKAGIGLRFLRELEQGKATLRMDKVNQVLRMFGHELGPVAMNRNELIAPETQNAVTQDAIR